MSAPSPWERSPLDEPEVDPASRRRRAAVAAVVVAGSLVLAMIVYLAAGRSGGTNSALTPVGPSGTTTTSTTTTAAPSSGPAPAPSTPTAVTPIHVDVVVGMVVIAGHMACTHEDELTGETVAAVEAAVAADTTQRQALCPRRRGSGRDRAGVGATAERNASLLRRLPARDRLGSGVPNGEHRRHRRHHQCRRRHPTGLAAAEPAPQPLSGRPPSGAACMPRARMGARG
jgi:hypothetical protein